MTRRSVDNNSPRSKPQQARVFLYQANPKIGLDGRGTASTPKHESGSLSFYEFVGAVRTLSLPRAGIAQKQSRFACGRQVRMTSPCYSPAPSRPQVALESPTIQDRTDQFDVLAPGFAAPWDGLRQEAGRSLSWGSSTIASSFAPTVQVLRAFFDEFASSSAIVSSPLPRIADADER